MARARVEPTARAWAVARFNQLSYETFTSALSNSNMYHLSLPTLSIFFVHSERLPGVAHSELSHFGNDTVRQINTLLR